MTTYTQQEKQVSLGEAVTKAKEQKKGAPFLNMLSNSDKLMAAKNLPSHVKSDMEEKFNANLDHIRLYESKLVEDTGANAYAGGASIAFAPGKLDFSSFAGKKLLGHELSHIVNKTDEFEADRVGAQIAIGESAYSSEFSSFDSMESVITPMSNSEGISDFAGPVAAKKADRKAMSRFKNQGKDKKGKTDKTARIAGQMNLIQRMEAANYHGLLNKGEKAALNKMIKLRTSTPLLAAESNRYLFNKSNEVYGDTFNHEKLPEEDNLFRTHFLVTEATAAKQYDAKKYESKEYDTKEFDPEAYDDNEYFAAEYDVYRTKYATTNIQGAERQDRFMNNQFNDNSLNKIPIAGQQMHDDLNSTRKDGLLLWLKELRGK